MKRTALALILALCLLASCGMAETVRSLPEADTITITMLMGVNQNKENNSVERAIQERLNVKLDITYVPSAGFNEKLNTTLASGQIPDIIQFLWKKTVPIEWIEQGAVLRLDDPENNLLEKYGQHVLATYNEENKDFQTDYAGAVYSVKGTVDFPYSTSCMIRADWLEKLNLEVPTTMDELVAVLRAFKTGDPNGNGLPDEIPFLSNGSSPTPFYDAFGICPVAGNYVLVDDVLVTKYEHPEFKNCLDLLRELYAEELIDPEFTASNNTRRDEIVSTDKVGYTYATGNEATRQTEFLRDNGIKDAKWIPIPPILGVGGQNIQGRNPINTCAAISSQAKDPEACMMVLDYIFSEEGQLLTNFGIEGIHHEIVDGKPHLLEPYCLTWAEARGDGIAMGTWAEVWKAENFLQITFQGKTAEDLDELYSLAYHAYVDNAPYAYFPLPSSVTDTETNRELSADIWTPLNDEANNYIMGLSDWESFENLLNELKDYGMDQITEEVNAAYQALK